MARALAPAMSLSSRIAFSSVALVFAGLGAFACGGSSTSSTPESSDKADSEPTKGARGSADQDNDKDEDSAETAGTPAAGGGFCCRASTQPGCCMRYGGWSQTSCEEAEYPICDGMPVPSDPDWKLEKDAHGCDHWTNPNGVWAGSYNENTNPDTDYCGAPVRNRDAG